MNDTLETETEAALEWGAAHPGGSAAYCFPERRIELKTRDGKLVETISMDDVDAATTPRMKLWAEALASMVTFCREDPAFAASIGL